MAAHVAGGATFPRWRGACQSVVVVVLLTMGCSAAVYGDETYVVTGLIKSRDLQFLRLTRQKKMDRGDQ